MELQQILDNNTIWGSEATKIQANFEAIEIFSDEIQQDLIDAQTQLQNNITALGQATQSADALLAVSISNLESALTSQISSGDLAANNRITQVENTLTQNINNLQSAVNINIANINTQLQEHQTSLGEIVDTMAQQTDYFEDSVSHIENLSAATTQTFNDTVQIQAFAEQAKNDAVAAKNSAQNILNTAQPILDNMALLLEIYSKLSKIEAVENALTEIEAVDSILSKVVIVANNILSVATLADNIANINDVHYYLTELNNVHSNLNALINIEASLTAINAVNAALTNINTAATNIAAINTAATNIDAIIAAPTHATTATNAAAAAVVTKGQVEDLKGDVQTLKSETNTLKLAAATSETNAGQSAAAAASSAAGAEADAIQLLRLHDPNLVFSGFVNTGTATPAHTANKAYIATASGTIFGISGVVKGQIIRDNGSGFEVENLYVNTVYDQNIWSDYANRGKLFDIYDNSSTNLDALSVFKELYLCEGFDATKTHKIGFLRRNAPNWAIILDEWNDVTEKWDRVYYGSSDAENTEWDVTASGKRVVAKLDWSKISIGDSGSLWGNETTGEPAVMINKKCYNSFAIERAAVKLINENYEFRNYVNESTPVPQIRANNYVYISEVDGNVFGLSVNKDDVIRDGLTSFSVISGRSLQSIPDATLNNHPASYKQLLQIKLQNVFELYDDSIDLLGLAAGITRVQALNAIKSFHVYGLDKSKFHKIGLLRRNYGSPALWGLILNEWNDLTEKWDRVYYQNVSEENNNWDVSAGDVRVIAYIQWDELPNAYTSSIWSGEPGLILNKNCYKSTEFPINLDGYIGSLPSTQEEFLTARSGYELFPCFYRVGEGSIDVDYDGLSGTSKRYMAYSAFKLLHIYGVDPTKKVRLGLFRRKYPTTDNHQLIFLQQQEDESWVRIFYGGGDLIENPNGATHFDFTQGGVRVVAEIDWNYVNVGSTGSVEPEIGNSIFEVKPELLHSFDENVENVVATLQTSVSNFGYDLWKSENAKILNELTAFRSKLINRADDIHIVLQGDSLTAQHNKTPLSNPEHRPVQMVCQNYVYHMHNFLNDVNIEADRFDSTNNPFTEVGVWSNIDIFDSNTLPYWTADNMNGGHITRYSNTPAASFQFSWDLDAYEKCHLIHRLDYRASDDVTLSIAEGDGKVEVWNGAAWVEANAYNFSQQLVTSAQGSGYANTLANMRLKLRRASAATGDVTLTFSKGSDSDYLFYWGVEKWNGNRIILTNIGRGGREVNALQDVVLNDILERKPDLVIFQLVLINEYGTELTSTHLTETILNHFQDYIWGDRAGNLNANSLKELSNDWADFQAMAIIPHYRHQFFESGNIFKKTDVYNVGDYMDETAWVCWNKTKQLFYDHADVPFLDMGDAFKREAASRGWSLQQAHDSAGLTSTDGFTTDTVHQNDLGSLIWAKYIAPIFNISQY